MGKVTPTSWWSESGVDLLEELLAGHGRREHAERAFRGGLVALGGRRRATISEGDRVEALLVSRAHRGLNAAVREEAAEHDRLDLLLHERRLEVRAREAVEAPLALDDDVALGPGLFYLCPTHSRPWLSRA